MISKKNLLRWNTAESVDASVINTRKRLFLTMWSSLLRHLPIIAFVIWQSALVGMCLAALVMADWLLAFEAAYRISQQKIIHHQKDSGGESGTSHGYCPQNLAVFLKIFPQRRGTGSVRITIRQQKLKESVIRHLPPISGFSFCQFFQPWILDLRR